MTDPPPTMTAATSTSEDESNVSPSVEREAVSSSSVPPDTMPRRTGVPARTASGYSSADSVEEGMKTTLPSSLTYCLYGMETAPDEDDWSNTEEENAASCPIAPHHVINIQHLRKLASRGIPDEGSHRGVVWRVLLGYLPTKTDEWTSQLQASRSFYQSCIQDLFADTHDARQGDALRWRPRHGQRTMPPASDDDDSLHGNEDDADAGDDLHTQTASDDGSFQRPAGESNTQWTSPLARPPPITPVLPESIKQAWKERGKDEHLLHKLNSSFNALLVTTPVSAKDDGGTDSNDNNGLETHGTDTVRSNSPSIGNVRDAHDYVEAAVLLDEIRKDVVRTHPDLAFFLEPAERLGERRYAAIERILFVWATYNKGVRYVQGMNEIVGAIYYVLAKDWKPEWAAHAEADAYFLFATLLAEMRDVFISDMDDSATGIQGRLAHMQTLLQMHDPEVKEHLDEVEVDVSFYAVRWWTTLLSREFLLPDTIRVWDSMFASTHKDNFMRYICVTMVLIIRDRILKSDFGGCIKLLQSYPPTHMDNLIEASRALWVYETQVSLAIHKGGYSRHMALQTIKPSPAIIMAFGFRKGVAPKTRAELIEEASGIAADRVRDATSKVATSARSYFGKANGLFNKYVQQYKGSMSTDSEEDPNKGIEEVQFSEEKLKAFEDDRYMSEFLDS